MSEYIERGALINDLNRFAPEHYNALVNDIITKQPAADVAPVCRCKDCKHKYNPESPDWLWCYYVDTNGDDFCSYGERRGG